ncbi:MAG: ribonuclease [Novosphingobium sp.]
MAEWLIEQGIGEHRAVLVEHGAIVAARVDWLELLAPGAVADAVLVSRTAGSARGTLYFPSGEEALIDGLPRNASEGATLRVAITRAAIAEAGRCKRAQARLTDAAPRPAPSLVEQLAGARVVRRFRQDGDSWEGLVDEAWDGAVAFAGGALTISPTPAMTVIDVDGDLPPRALALAAIRPLAAAIHRFELAGSIGVDFPTLADRVDRKAVDDALAEALADWPHRRTAMNGFGFVQLVSRLERPSLIHRIALDPAGAAARELLRRAERVDEPGLQLLTAHPDVLAAMRPEWRAELARRTGRQARWQADPGLAPQAGFAQALRE